MSRAPLLKKYIYQVPTLTVFVTFENEQKGGKNKNSQIEFY
jgi:hypothetical protein